MPNLIRTFRRALNLIGLDLRRASPFLARHDNILRSAKPFRDLLPESLLENVTVTAAPTEIRAEGRLADLWRDTKNSVKWQHYFSVYEKAFSPLVGKPVKFLEIGVQNGGSLTMWKRYFGANATVVGIDIDPSCAKFDRPDKNIHVRIGSQADPDFLASVIKEFGPFDGIVDDGSHMSSHIVVSFGALFDTGLRPGASYLVEDTHATYWRSHRNERFAFSQFCAYLTDLLHAPYWTPRNPYNFTHDDPDQIKELQLPKLATLLHRIEAEDSIVRIVKSAERPVLPQNGFS